MTNSPKLVDKHTLMNVYDACAARLADCEREVLYRVQYAADNTMLPGVVEYRIEQRSGIDGSCSLLADIYSYEDGREVEFIVVLEVDGDEYAPVQDHPHVLSE